MSKTFKYTLLSAAALVIMINGCGVKPIQNNKNHCTKQTISIKTDKPKTMVHMKKREIKIPEIKTVINKIEVKEPSELYPPNAKPGHCYRKVFQTAKYKYVSERVLVEEAGEKIKTIPAKYGYKTERILISGPKTEWERHNCNGKVDCETMCLVQKPAEYKTIRKKVLLAPARTEVIPVPAKYETIQKKVKVSDPSFKWVETNCQRKVQKPIKMKRERSYLNK